MATVIKLYVCTAISIVIFVMACVYLMVSAHLNSTKWMEPDTSFRSSPVKREVRCYLNGSRWIIVTTIFYPTEAIHKFLRLKSIWNVLVIGDRKTPTDWLSRLKGDQSRLWFLSIADQAWLNYSILKYLPEGSYARKNIGYLLAIQCGAKIIFESDDDNLLDTDDIYRLPKIVNSNQAPWIAFHRKRSPFVNIYGSFGQPNLWPRGFPIDELRNVTEDGWHSVRRNVDHRTNVYIQQYLADLDPDVDALYRLTHPLSVGRIHFDRDQLPIVLEPWTFSPYNTQNTVTYYEAFWGLYLPVTTTFRVCDIWRGLWVQRLLWDINGRLMFGTATVKQVRNSHSWIEDMDDEYQLYHQSGSFARFLSQWKSSLPTLNQRIAQLAEEIARAKFWSSNEVMIIRAWLDDLQRVGYRFPSVISIPSATSTTKRVAICVTGTAECIEGAWRKTYQTLHAQLRGDFDTFLFLSSSNTSGPISTVQRLKEARAFQNSTVTVLYEDRNLHSTLPDAQRLWALSQCYELVKEYEQQRNIRYAWMLQTRVDIRVPAHFQLELDTLVDDDANRTLWIPFDSSNEHLDLSFAMGAMKVMHYYMNQSASSEIFSSQQRLLGYLQQFMRVPRVKRLPSIVDIVPYGSHSCH